MNVIANSVINWDDLPANANWVAMDESEMWCWYKEPPFISNNCVWDSSGDYDEFDFPPCDDWTKSLQSRPSPSVAIPSPPVPIEPLSQEERTVVNAEIESLNEQLRTALAQKEHLNKVAQDAHVASMQQRYEIQCLRHDLSNADNDNQKLIDVNVRMLDEIAGLRELLQEKIEDALEHGYKSLSLVKKDDDDDGWIAWEATADSVCPVNPKTIVKYRLESSDESEDPAGNIDWSARLRKPARITAYKIVDTSSSVAIPSTQPNDLSWALAQVFRHRKLVTRDVVPSVSAEGPNHWRLGLFMPIDSGQRREQLVWTNGTDWHPCVIGADDYNGTWKAYNDSDISTKGDSQE
jgi:hypothetical protein